MKYYRWITLSIAIFTTSAYALQPTVEIIEQFDNIKVVAVISENDINNSPMWNPDIDAPPLSVKDALHSIRDFNKQSKTTYSVKEIEIRTIKRHPGYWHYLIKTVPNDMNMHKYDVYVVLMDGKVIPAIIEPESYK